MAVLACSVVRGSTGMHWRCGAANHPPRQGLQHCGSSGMPRPWSCSHGGCMRLAVALSAAASGNGARSVLREQFLLSRGAARPCLPPPSAPPPPGAANGSMGGRAAAILPFLRVTVVRDMLGRVAVIRASAGQLAGACAIVALRLHVRCCSPDGQRLLHGHSGRSSVPAGMGLPLERLRSSTRQDSL